MNQRLIEDRAVLEEFLRAWDYSRVCSMKLDEYVVGAGNTNTFCYWVETRTKRLGNINGVPANKFGIFKYRKKNPEYKRLQFDDEYAWLGRHVNNRNEAFENTLAHIKNIIKYAARNELEKIEDIPINGIFKWKVAFLYSKEGFIPIFSRNDLGKIAQQLGMTVRKKTPTCDIHRFVFSTFDGESVYDYMAELYHSYRSGEGKTNKQVEQKQRERASTDHKNTDPHNRKDTLGGIVNQHHNELQNDLYDKLVSLYTSRVSMEKDFVDISVELDDRKLLYEVKSDSSPTRCVREALGQLLHYAHRDRTNKPIEFIVYGKNKPSVLDEMFIKFIQSTLNQIVFRYESVE